MYTIIVKLYLNQKVCSVSMFQKVYNCLYVYIYTFYVYYFPGSVKKLHLTTDISMNQTQRMTASPIPSEPVKPKTVLQPQPVTLGSPPKAS